MTDKLLLAIDQGTTSSRAIIFDDKGNALASRQKELKLHYPHKGWVEQNPIDIWEDTLWASRKVIEDIGNKAQDIAGLGITNQRETTIIWDRSTGEPIYNAIVWQDRRTAEVCQKLKEAGAETLTRQRTGLLLDPYFSATKINWILDNVEGAREKAEAGALAFGTVDCWLLWKLTNGTVHATDATNASRTLLFNIITQQWDESLLELFNIPPKILPDVKDNVADFGHTTPDIFDQQIEIGGMAGDQHAALIGQACFQEGMVKSTYGTGCFALMNIGPTFKPSENRLLTTPAYRLDGQTTYAIEGSIFIAGAAIQWLRDNLGLFKDAAESEVMANAVDDNNGVYFVPAFTGLGAPYWDPNAKASISGLTRESNANHITRAALEAQAYQTLDLMDAMRNDTSYDPEVIRADGGLVANSFVCQFISDMLGKPVEIPQMAETTALGAAYLAGLKAGIFDSLEDISKSWQCAQRYDPKLDDHSREQLYSGWKNALRRVL